MKLARKPDNKGKQVAAAAGAGMIAGAVAATLLTPRSGSEVRKGIKSKADSMKSKMHSDSSHDDDAGDIGSLS